jgi:hypothetical protein
MLRLTSVLVTALASTQLLAQDVFSPGIEAKRAGLDSVSAVKSAPALFFNPAQLMSSEEINGGYAPYVEIGMVQAQYSYEHRDFDPVRVEVQSPLITLGGTYRSQTGRWAAGAAFFPAKRGGIEIAGMPRRVGAETMALEVDSKESAYRLAYGASLQTSTRTSLGLSLVHGFERKQVNASLIGAVAPLVQQELADNSTRAVAGLTQSTGSGSDLSLAYATAITKKYDGSEKLATNAAALPAATVAYDPANIGIGMNLAVLPKMSAQLSANYRMWSSGREVIREGITSTAGAAELKDIVETGMSLKYQALTQWALIGSVARLPSPWGDGRFSNEAGQSLVGPGFGQNNLVDRRVMGLGISGKISDAQSLDLSFSNSSGSREIQDGGANPGFYQANISTMSVATVLSF